MRWHMACELRRDAEPRRRRDSRMKVPRIVLRRAGEIAPRGSVRCAAVALQRALL